MIPITLGDLFKLNAHCPLPTVIIIVLIITIFIAFKRNHHHHCPLFAFGTNHSSRFGPQNQKKLWVKNPKNNNNGAPTTATTNKQKYNEQFFMKNRRESSKRNRNRGQSRFFQLILWHKNGKKAKLRAKENFWLEFICFNGRAQCQSAANEILISGRKSI